VKPGYFLRASPPFNLPTRDFVIADIVLPLSHLIEPQASACAQTQERDFCPSEGSYLFA
jgi:hypothetical protein